MNRNLVAASICAVAIALVAVVAINAGSSRIAGRAVPGDDGALAVAAAPPATTTTSREPDPLDLDDFVITLKVTDKQCFGDVGCNVTVEPNLEYVHTLDTLENRTFSITLTITGDETGPVITTIEGTGTQYDLMPVLLSTRGPGVAPKAKITAVQEY